MLNYIEQINLLHKIRQRDSLDVTAIALHVLLLHMCNSNDWENPLVIKNDRVMIDLDVSFKTLAAARNRLKQSGLINFKTKAGTAHCQYQILTPAQCTCARTLVKNTEVTAGVTDKVPDEVQHEVQGKVTNQVPPAHLGYYINQNKNQTKTKNSHAAAPGNGLNEKNNNEKNTGLVNDCLNVYTHWFTKKFGLAPKTDGRQHTAAGAIAQYFLQQAQLNAPTAPPGSLHPQVVQAWQTLLGNWHLLDGFHQKQTSLTQINNNLQNLIIQIRTQHASTENQPAINRGATPFWRKQGTTENH